MPTTDLSLILEPDALESLLDSENLLVVDLSKPATYAQGHIRGAVHLDYGKIIHAEKPVMGLLPDAESINHTLSALGVSADAHVVAYDDEGGGHAARLLWTLEAMGHSRYSLLNGGLHAWANEGHALVTTPVTPQPAKFTAHPNAAAVADWEFILANLQNSEVRVLDARSADEYNGSKRFAARGGHIPGAVNMEWTQAMDMDRNLRLQAQTTLTALLNSLGITPEKEIIVYCQTHHRSAHTYVMLKSLGFEDVRGYAGSWSEWGNRSDTPIE